jgi:hypothetical protein
MSTISTATAIRSTKRHRAQRKRRNHQCARRQAEHARHLDRLPTGRTGIFRRPGQDMPQLDEQHGGHGNARSPRSPRITRRRIFAIVKLVPSVARDGYQRRMQPRRITQLRRQRFVLLLCGELVDFGAARTVSLRKVRANPGTLTIEFSAPPIARCNSS